MMLSIHWYGLIVALAGMLAAIAIAAPRRRRIKALSIICTTAILPLALITMNDLLSRPKPMQLENALKNLDEASVVASLMNEGEAIYLWLKVPDVEEPRSYQLPWNEEMAVELHKAQREAEALGTEVQMNQPFSNVASNDEPLFYPKPPPALPVKAGELEDPVVLRAAQPAEAAQ